MFQPNLGPSSVVDQKSTWHGDLYTQKQQGEGGAWQKNVARIIAEPKGEASNRGARVAVSLYVSDSTVVLSM